MTAEELKAVSNDIISAAQGRASNRTRFDKVKSKVGTYGHKKFKAANVPGAVMTVVTEFIPIPGVGTVASMVVDKGTAAVKSRYDAGKSAAAAGQGGYKKIKRDIKDLDIESIDRYRHKVADQVKAFNETVKAKQAPACDSAFAVAYRFGRIKYRVGILRDAATKMKDISTRIVEWCDKVDSQAKPEILDKAVQAHLLRHDAGVPCGRHCVVSGGRSAATEFNKVTTTLKLKSR